MAGLSKWVYLAAKEMVGYNMFFVTPKKAETLYMVLCQTFLLYIYCLESSADVNLLNISPETSGSPLMTSLMVIEPVMI